MSMISSSDKFIFWGANGDEAGTIPGIYGQLNNYFHSDPLLKGKVISMILLLLKGIDMQVC